MAMNYGFAFRLSTLAAMRPLLAASLGVRDGRLVVDTVHNSIYEESVGGEPAIVHRHNACRIFPAEALAGHPAFAETGQPLLLPGTNRTSSYMCLPSARAAAALHTVCHTAREPWSASSPVVRLSRPSPGADCQYLSERCPGRGDRHNDPPR
jgi:RNA-splicing ligase RtcB